MNLNLIEMLQNFQLITIRNGSDGNNIKPQVIKGKLNKKKSIFILDSRKFSSY